MPVRVRLPAILRDLPGSRATVELGGPFDSVSEAFDALWRQVPGVRDRVLTETGDVREHVQVFVGFESIRFTGGLATAVPEDAEIHIVPAVSGG
jgi:molybdopterin converting factor small subunit